MPMLMPTICESEFELFMQVSSAQRAYVGTTHHTHTHTLSLWALQQEGYTGDMPPPTLKSRGTSYVLVTSLLPYNLFGLVGPPTYTPSFQRP